MSNNFYQIKANSVINEYFNFHSTYENEYGKDKCIVLMQVGKFFEAYGTDTVGPNLSNVSKQIDVIRSQKNKNISKISLKNPYFLGFPTISLIKFLELLVRYYTVIVIEQIKSVDDVENDKYDSESSDNDSDDSDSSSVSNSSYASVKHKKKVVRKVTGIYSKGTLIENINNREAIFLTCITISEEKQPTGKILFACGMSAIDLSTGVTYVHESHSAPLDNTLSIDEVSRFISSLSPKEILIYYNAVDVNNPKYLEDDILNYLDIDKLICRYYIGTPKKYTSVSYQNEVFQKVYENDKSVVCMIDKLGLAQSLYASSSLTLLIDFVYGTNKQLLKNILTPNFYLNGKGHLILGNNACNQLNIIDESSDVTKFKSLFRVVNKTVTAMGERFLKATLVSPITNVTTLETIYDQTDEIIKYKLRNKLNECMTNIKDIERLERRIAIGILKPLEIAYVVSSCESVVELITFLKNLTKAKTLSKIMLKDITVDNVKKSIKEIKEIFDLDEMSKYPTFEFKTSIFLDGVYDDIDELKEKMDKGHSLIESLRDTLIKLLELKQSGAKGITVKSNNRDGYYLVLTSARLKILQKKLSTMDVIQLNNGKTIKTKILTFSDSGKSGKIHFKKLDKESDDMDKYVSQMDLLCKKHYYEFLTTFYKKYHNTFTKVIKFITNIDFITSCATLKTEYNYVRPVIDKKKYGYVDATDLRHPIVERLIEHEYIPHDITIGKPKLKGMLIYGLNSSGKSVLMKAVGLSLILAHAGLPVPAKTFIFSPYDSIYTRIAGNDNIFKGLSSFGLEMVELNAILKRANEKTLVIGDEICKGTEHISGNALVASSIVTLSKLHTSFIFATHLHEVATLEEVSSIENVKPFHLQVKYDEINDKLIYSRSLADGTGEPIYGITVARHIIQNKEFIDMALSIKNKLMNTNKSIVSGKKSKYNPDVYVHECQICHTQESVMYVSNLETHHINHQKDCEDGFVKTKKHITKNAKCNVVILCKKCHDKVHNGKISINGYDMTTQGRQLNYKINK
jgi:DNA mismatch repair protein MutS